ncbi:hypothetical protein Halru_1784 [Halovivax ruber XH-70]|uniref:Roadblock/LAMTOR2 domain-containing protein n=1 Tax=Halovivax ruber (strain DSM 18193 / JCM 13892 / XH-70) TaxID=797302 RepID=L0IC40_HALRX|nr:hypothetical protein [Halovivax ruber]AGB16383.1 hypothetical protein Halru_1784 [Halovivax ruber XH-70]
MSDRRVDELYAVVTDRFGDGLRSVAAYGEDGIEIRYMRDDVESLYDAEDHGRVFRTLRLEAMDRPTQESLFVHDELRCTYRVFDGATEMNVATSETAGVLVSVDATLAVELRETTDAILDALDSDDGDATASLNEDGGPTAEETSADVE